MSIHNIKPLEFAYTLEVNCHDDSRSQKGNTIYVNDRKFKQSYTNEQWRRNVHFDFIDDEVRALIENSDQDASHPYVAQTIELFTDFNERMQSCKDTASMSAAIDDAYFGLCDIWGSHAIDPRDETIEKFAEEFDDFLKVCEDLDSKEPPVPMDTEVHYALNVTKAKRINLGTAKRFGLMAGSKPRFTGSVPLWQLPAAFYQLQEKLGIAPDVEEVGMFRLYIECIAKKQEDCFRVAVNGNDTQGMLDELSKKLEEQELEHSEGAQYRVIMTHYASEFPFYLSADVSAVRNEQDASWNMAPFQTAIRAAIKKSGRGSLQLMLRMKLI